MRHQAIGDDDVITTMVRMEVVDEERLSSDVRIRGLKTLGWYRAKLREWDGKMQAAFGDPVPVSLDEYASYPDDTPFRVVIIQTSTDFPLC